ncbi:hypothetical protein AFERRI_530141 [Acidithiobacillus ferrivorans]|uniref:Uncharacterized protein n=1 Tax=Acidithiobacillus ferrivorans TaxID=160808 RepID=A0A060USE1_9PROT|nr:hypothetical protein AFERRI_530141 [Acidithiobacillus ferrivorans]
MDIPWFSGAVLLDLCTGAGRIQPTGDTLAFAGYAGCEGHPAAPHAIPQRPGQSPGFPH